MVSARIQCRRCFCHRGRLRALVLVAAAVSLFSYYRQYVDGEPPVSERAGGTGERSGGRPRHNALVTKHPEPSVAAVDVAAACAAAPPVTPAPADGLRHVVHYNVLNGIHDLARRHRLCEWLRAQEADVVTFNELNFWVQADLESFGQQCGFEHALLLQTNSPYRVGALSRSDPIVLVGKYLKGFGHGALHFATGGWHFVVTHLTPHGGQEGLAEARLLLKNIDNLVPVDAPLLILGDLNCLSPHDADRYNELHLASVLDKKKIATGKSKHGLAAKFLTKDGKAVNYEIFSQFMVAGYADLRPAAIATPPWQLPPTSSGGSVKWPRQSVPTSLHDDAMHAAPMRLDYALANSAAQRRMGFNPENWHAGPVQTLFTDTLSDHFPLQVLLCEGGISGQSSGDCATKINARLEAREDMEARLKCDSDGWNKWKLRHVTTTQNAAREAVSSRLATAMRARPASIIEAEATAIARTRGASQLEDGTVAASAIGVIDKRIQAVIDWTDPLLWRPSPRSPSSEPTLASTGGDLDVGRSWEVVRVRGRAGASCTQVCLDEGRRRRDVDRQHQHTQQARSSTNIFQAPPVATADSAPTENGLGASRQVPGGFELKPGGGGLRRDRRRLAEHYEHSASLFGHAFNTTKLKELEQREQAEHEKLTAGADSSRVECTGGHHGDSTCHTPCDDGCSVEQVAAAMTASPSDGTVQLNGCRAFAKMLRDAGGGDPRTERRNREATQVAIVDVGGVALVEAALSGFTSGRLTDTERDNGLRNCQDAVDELPLPTPTPATLPTADFAAEAALAGAVSPEQDGWEREPTTAGLLEQEDCLVHETHGVCANGGLCIHLFGGATCACEQGFSGHHCDNIADVDQEVHRSEVDAGSETVSPGDQRLADAVARVKARDEDTDLVLKADVLSGARGPQAKALLMEVMDTPAGAMTRERMTALLRKGAQGVEVDLDVLLLARTLAMQQLPPGVQQAIGSEPAQRLHPQAGSGADTTQRAPAPLPVTELDWRCSAKQIEVSNDCEQMTAEFGCANGCREVPFGYPLSGDPAPCFSAWEGDMLPQVCIIAGSANTGPDSPHTPPEQNTVVAGCTYGAPLVGKFLPGCVGGCKAHSTLDQALVACSKQNTCGGVTQSADQGHSGYQLRASTVPHEQPSDAKDSQREVSWVKKECEGGAGGSSDLCGKRDMFGHAQRLCSCIAPVSR